MSRIHEALKKAELERAASQGGPVESAEINAHPGQEYGSPTMAGMPAPVASAGPSFAAAYSFDTLLARCPQGSWRPDPKTMLFFGADEQAYGTEEFRTLRSRLYQLREKQGIRKLLISSSLPKEGKSFVAANLAQVIVRQQGRRVLLIDADLRGPQLHNNFGTTSTPGLAEYLRGEMDEFGVMQRGPMENLFFIPSGKTMKNPGELVANGRMKFLLSRVEPLFDWIIIDSPPAVPVSDAALLANYCDGVLMVVRSNATPFDIARKARQEFNGKNLIGVVLNGIEAGSSPYTEYYYSAYGRPNGKAEA
jgi:capsular exopolysaccharide synthesis family protein